MKGVTKGWWTVGRRGGILALATVMAGQTTTAQTPKTKAAKVVTTSESIPSDSLLRIYRWRNLGPLLDGGKINDIAVVPSPPTELGGKTLFVASESGGLW